MSGETSLLHGIKTLRSVRKFRQDPVADDVIRSILKAATRAASGSNTQPWEFVVVRDAKVKARLTEPMLRAWMERLGSFVLPPEVAHGSKDKNTLGQGIEIVQVAVAVLPGRERPGQS